jgi:hypothetical protein
MWEPQHLTTLWAFMACYRSTFTLRFRETGTIPSPLQNKMIKKLVTEIIRVYSVNHHCIPLVKCKLKHVMHIVLYIYLIYLSIYSPCGCWPLFQLINLYTFGRTPWTGDGPVTGPLPKHSGKQTQNKSTQTFLPRVGFEPTIPVFKRVKTVQKLVNWKINQIEVSRLDSNRRNITEAWLS